MVADSLIDFTAGTVAGFAGKLLDYPLDTVKVLLQTENVGDGAAAPRYRGAWHCLQHTFQTRGVQGLYKGLSSPLLGSMAENAVLFVSYSAFQRALMKPGQERSDLSLFQLALAGGGAGGVVAFLLTPIELIKCRLQVQNSASSGVFHHYKGPVDVMMHTLKNEGLVQGLYRGHSSTLLREIPGNFCWYGVYEGVCMAMIPEGKERADLSPLVHLFGGATAGVAYWTAFYPADTVKSLIQTHPDYSRYGFLDAFRVIWRAEGLRGLYRGWGVTVARAIPAHAAIFAAYEYTIKLLRPPSVGGRSKEDVETEFRRRESIRD